jgi:hypothetical protein
MASTIPSLAALVAQNDQNLDPAYVSDLLQGAPMVAALFSKPASNGTLHKYLKTTVAPTVAFRDVGAGRDHSTFTQVLVTATLKLLDASFHVDKAYADAHKDGVDRVMEQSGMEHLKQAFAATEKQLIYGTGALGDSTGFAGFVQNTAIDAVADAMVVNAGSAVADQTSSVYLLRTDDSNVALVAGQNAAGKMLDVGQRIEQFMPDADGKFYPAYASVIHAWLGLQYGSVYSIGRIANIGPSSNSLTDTLIATAIGKFPVDRQPNALVMSRRSLAQLRASRTATNGTGAPAPFPTEAFGVPIVCTDAVSDIEPVLA